MANLDSILGVIKEGTTIDPLFEEQEETLPLDVPEEISTTSVELIVDETNTEDFNNIYYDSETEDKISNMLIVYGLETELVENNELNVMVAKTILDKIGSEDNHLKMMLTDHKSFSGADLTTKILEAVHETFKELRELTLEKLKGSSSYLSKHIGFDLEPISKLVEDYRMIIANGVTTLLKADHTSVNINETPLTEIATSLKELGILPESFIPMIEEINTKIEMGEQSPLNIFNYFQVSLDNFKESLVFMEELNKNISLLSTRSNNAKNIHTLLIKRERLGAIAKTIKEGEDLFITSDIVRSLGNFITNEI